jgi:hypothetical protein
MVLFASVMRVTLALIIATGILCSSVLARGKNTRAEAKTLVERNRELTDIRSSGSPSFKLRATFLYKSADMKSNPVEGIYELHWDSPQRWRESFQVGYTKVMRVFAGGSLSRSSEGTFPISDIDVSDIFIAPIEVLEEYPADIQDSPRHKTAAKCVDMRYAPPDCPGCTENTDRIACFDPATGLLKQLQVLGNPKPDLWDYDAYEAFGSGKFVPRVLKMQTSEGDYAEARIVGIETATFADSEFEPLPAPVPSSPCDKTAPRVLHDPEPRHSQQGQAGRKQDRTVFRVLVGPDGVPISAIPLKSGGDLFDREAVRGLMKWRFAPATCKGKPVPVSIAVELQSH